MIEILRNLKINGKKTNEDTIVIDKHINNNIPIDDVPLWFEIASVEKEDIVVKPLKNTALGVLLFITSIILPLNSKNLLI